MKTATLFALFGAAAMWAGQAEYFPLQVGNEWVLQTRGEKPQLLHIEVLRGRNLNGHDYYLVTGYAPQASWLRVTGDGHVVSVDEWTGEETTLAVPAAGGASYPMKTGGCEQTAQPADRVAAYKGPNYELSDTIAIRYTANHCADVGLNSEVYAPGLGLVRRALTTIQGETAFDLVYARVNGKAVLGKSKEIVLPFDFRNGSKGWLAGFSDYTLRTSDLRMMAELRELPDEENPGRTGYFLQSMNRSDDLFMFLKKQLATEDGIEANQAYRLYFDIRFWSNAPTGCVGVGGSPGDSVYLKAGATLDEPATSVDGSGYVHVLANKGQQAEGGKDAGVAGTIANGRACDGRDWSFARVAREYAHAGPVRTDDRGTMWLLLGTDSAFEGLTPLYIESITVRINPEVEPAGGPKASRLSRN